MTEQQDLATRCETVEDLSRAALDWIDDPENADIVGAERKSLVQLLRRSARRAWRLGKSAHTRMSVSVFGPSQAGKSFLVSVLARPENGRLVADFNGPGGNLDYISEINPEGEGESTGLVTRFTMVKAPTPDGFPIRVTLLSEADIVRTLVNSFFMDGDQTEPVPDSAALTERLDRFRGRAGPDAPGLSYETMFEIADYVENTFGRSAYVAALKSFWDEAAQIAPGLSLADRGAFLDVLWGGHAPFTDLYVRMAGALGRIGHAEEVYVGLDALTPRETSIIDVKTLHGLFAPDGGGALALQTPSGQRLDLPRAELCALAAELVMPMQSQPSDIFAETDLLDFPGARNRFEQPLSKTLAEPEKSLTQLLLRGKVAYLFDRYVENQEITSMLLCVPDSNMETLDLPGLVENWIGMTHGSRPEVRARSDCILFFVLTKFDKHLGESAAGGGEATRFERRMQASLLEKFGRSKDNWVEVWTPDQPFRNCYWLRNPNFFVEGLLDYDADQREIRIRPEKEARVAELRAGCLEAPSVRKHFADPEAAWDAALSLNDGGVSYLTGRLGAVCRPDSKFRQIRAQITKVAGDLHRSLAPFHVSDDVEERIAEKAQAAAEVIDCLELALARHRFGAVLAALMVDQDVIEDRIARVPSSIRISSAVAAATQAEAGGAAPLRPNRPLRPGRPAAAPAEAQDPPPGRPAIRTMSHEQFQAEGAIEAWIERLKAFAGDADRLRVYGFTEKAAADLTAELIHAARRTGVGARLVRRLGEVSFGLSVDRQALPAAIVCAETINGFVATLGADALPPADRPRIALPDGTERPVFTDRPASDGVDDLPAQPRATAETLWSDWAFALDALFVANAKDTDAGEINIEQNLKLGKVIAGLAGDGEGAG